jgi:hypothetical protein
VDTVVYHIAVLRDMLPNSMNVLSLFSGIGGAEVALHKLGIRLKNVVIVEKCKASRDVVKDRWEGNKITKTLIQIDDVKKLTTHMIEEFVRRFGGFDLVIDDSPCNNRTIMILTSVLEWQNLIICCQQLHANPLYLCKDNPLQVI